MQIKTVSIVAVGVGASDARIARAEAWLKQNNLVERGLAILLRRSDHACHARSTRDTSEATRRRKLREHEQLSKGRRSSARHSVRGTCAVPR